MRSMNTHLDFDLNLAKDQSDKNPVFYLQYALQEYAMSFVGKTKDLNFLKNLIRLY